MSEIQKAVVYARVSSKKQKTEGSGLASQITRCSEFARHKRYEVTDVFTDDMTGRLAGRPGVTAMLKYLRQHRNETVVVIIDDISRLARDTDVHSALRKSIRKAGGVLESPSIEFAEDSDSILVENLLASVAQHHSQKNSEQVVNRMRARLLAGFAAFHPPPGYRWEKQKGGGKVYVVDEPVASIMREVLEGFAVGRFTTQAEVKRYLEQHPAYPSPTGQLSTTSIRSQLTNPAYAGYIVHEPWGVSLRVGQHEPIISYETHLKIQERLTRRSHAPARANIGEDFALRGFVTCGDCEEPLYSCWSKGRSKRYPYYFCQTKGCDSYGKSIQRDKLENDFETLLKALQPNRVLFDLIVKMMKDICKQRGRSIKSLNAALQKDIAKIDKQISGLVDRVVDTDSSALVETYEKRIKKLESRRADLNEKLSKKHSSRTDIQSKTRTALAFLSSPWNLWKTGRMEDRRAVLKLTFCGHIPYQRGSGFRTAHKEKLSMPFRVLEGFPIGKCEMVGDNGLEPLTLSV